MACFFAKATTFLPSPMVARNFWGSNALLFSAAVLAAKGFSLSKSYASGIVPE
jgi:hypothetical protein